ncbi:MAG: hypothetical protein F6K50_08110 [Moorea sp. SIO3I7]|uniref:hypothetical protein n=1 Tax=unclassified Moorena TaxID=2683338 RepID=UPI0013C25B75|nr:MULTISPECIES: hypothetical protein [unclassified Moorena]NEN95489.1 hypothetical protein [Moorena sp. SIO3I7]NEO65611.1 hypothetical protein [Moorena sp. SIO4G2]NEO06866.1 hypothetical protein [Moorena sp. SIO3I8]NEO22946.1 hypothetical protein [Moorena sp. SIO4A5]NEP23842.1 hypothetical protein [Moorena sp. SIO3I6]
MPYANRQLSTYALRARCLDAVAHGGNPQDRNGAFSVGELNSPRVAPLHRYLRCF